MDRISYDELKDKLMNPDIPDREIAPYLMAVGGRSGPFDPRVVPDPTKVQLTREGDFDVESAMRWGNAICRWRRQQRFARRLADGEKLPVLVSEGDSWFQFPFLIDDVIDQLEPDFLIWSLDAAGDTADNMVNRQPEYKAGLDRQKANGVQAFLFSGAGNDVIGEDLDGKPVLGRLLRPYSPGKDAAWHVDKAALASVLTRLERDYRKVVATIRADTTLTRLPIFFHGYDYCIPGGFAGDTRHPTYARQDEWLGTPLREKGIVDPNLQRAIIRVLVDALYDMLKGVAGDPNTTRIHVVDIRGTLRDGDWADEIHGTSAGFAKVGLLFATAICQALGQA